MRHTQPSILIIDDNRDWTLSVAMLLSRYRVSQAHFPRDGLRLARRQPFGLYILDQFMPGMTGLELCRRIREFDANTPVMMCSANRIASRMLVSAGATSFFEKAQEVTLFLRQVETLLHDQSTRNDTARAEEEAALREYRTEAGTALAAEGSTLSTRLKMVRNEVVAARRKLEEIRAARAHAFQVYVERGGSRAGFVSDWPKVATSFGAQ